MCFPVRAGGFNFSIQMQKPPWVRIGTPMFRPHQSLELDEIVKKLNRTWGCNFDLVDFAPPGSHRTAGYLPSTYKLGARAWWRAWGRPWGADRSDHTNRYAPTTPIARALRDLQKVRQLLTWTLGTRRLGVESRGSSAGTSGTRRTIAPCCDVYRRYP